MHSRLSIFSSRVLRSAVVWTIVLVVLIEAVAAHYLPERFVSHIVDERLLALDHGMPNTPVLLLGDSVAHQLGPGLEQAFPDRLRSLTCILMIETPGQYYLFRRYLEHHPPPEAVLLIMGKPLRGNLSTTFTENYFQRCFLRWREIGGVALVKHSPVFTATMVTYKLFPSLRYRNHLQRYLPWLAFESPSGGANQGETPVHKQPANGLLSLLGQLIPEPAATSDIAEQYFRCFLKDTDRLGIRLVVAIRPMPALRQSEMEAGCDLRLQVDELKALSKTHPLMQVLPDVNFFPDDWFADDIHLKAEHVEEATAIFQKQLSGRL
jgi:hypothetical protein